MVCARKQHGTGPRPTKAATAPSILDQITFGAAGSVDRSDVVSAPDPKRCSNQGRLTRFPEDRISRNCTVTKTSVQAIISLFDGCFKQSVMLQVNGMRVVCLPPAISNTVRSLSEMTMADHRGAFLSDRPSRPFTHVRTAGRRRRVTHERRRPASGASWLRQMNAYVRTSNREKCDPMHGGDFCFWSPRRQIKLAGRPSISLPIQDIKSRQLIHQETSASSV